jgi:outer membrane protein TolC
MSRPRALLPGLLAALCLATSPASAQPAAPSAQPAPTAPLPAASAAPLGLDEVLASADRAYPALLAAEQEQAQARGAAQEADGAFDLAWKSRATFAPLGYYRNTRLDSIVEQPTTIWGARAFAGWRLGSGDFAVYDGKLETNQYGEARAGLFVPILRGGSIDGRRAAQAISGESIRIADLSLEERRLEIARQATQRYWGWVAAGQRVEVARSLLDRATARDTSLGRRADRGDIASIERLDSARSVLQRQGQLVSAERALEQSAIALSLFLRDAAGNAEMPPAARLPRSLPEPTEAAVGLQEGTAQALDRRPELRRVVAQRRQLEVERSLHRNTRLPALDLQLTISRDFGPGSPTRQPTDFEASILLDVPIQNRVAEGKLAQAEAKLAKNEADGRLARDRVTAEVRDALSAIETSRRRLVLARAELDLARKLEEAERQRFDLGDSTLLVVNLREQATFDAALREIDGLVDYQLALANQRAALALRGSRGR